MFLFKKYLFTLLIFISSAFLYSQGLVEIPLVHNPVLQKLNKQGKGKSLGKALSIYDTISLPPFKGLFDDFSNDGPYPDTAIWLDNDVFINRGYGKAPITIGVATFEGLDENGYPYNFIVSETSSLPSDSLTSKPIHLNYPSGDSLYLSFFCQPQGNGEKPETSDSLVLEFKAPGTASVWKHIWSIEGSTLAKEDSSWTLVMIPILDTAFLKSGFQFRFRNYATQSGNLDHWQIDYVYLNRFRSYNDTLLNDIAWVYNGESLLNNYHTMPWKQYKQSELRTSFQNLIRNNYDSTQYIKYDYIIRDDSAASIINTFNGTVNILAFDANKVYTECDIPTGCIKTVPNTTSLFPLTLTKATQFSIQHFYENTLGDYNFKNDTLLVLQNFSNYYAYDDGTAENAVGLNVLDAQLAEKYTLNVEDTLQAIEIYFNPIVENATLYAFYLNVWNDFGGMPGIPIYTSANALSPIYNQIGQDDFARYVLDAPLLLGAGTYYFGFTQKTDEFLNVGQDKNNNHQDKTFYNVGEGWLNSELEGSVMIHPMFGAKDEFVGMTEIENQKLVEIYPNPTNDKLYIKFKFQNVAQFWNYTILDLYGRELMVGKTENSDGIDVSSLIEGIYVIRIWNGVSTETKKFVKTN